jgi:hypothetical protein
MSNNQGQVPQNPNRPLLQLPHADLNVFDQVQGDERNQFVGNTIYGTILQAFGQDLAPRLTGMLLDESAVNFKSLLTD